MAACAVSALRRGAAAAWAPGHRYLLRVTVSRGYGASITKDFFFWVRNYAPPPPPTTAPPIKVGRTGIIPDDHPPAPWPQCPCCC